MSVCISVQFSIRFVCACRLLFLQRVVCSRLSLSVFIYVCHNKSLENMSELILHSPVHHCLTNGSVSAPNDRSQTASLVY